MSPLDQSHYHTKLLVLRQSKEFCQIHAAAVREVRPLKHIYCMSFKRNRCAPCCTNTNGSESWLDFCTESCPALDL